LFLLTKMRRFSANYIFTNTGQPIRNGVVGIDDSGVVTEIIDHSDGVKEYAHTEFRNGIIVPGFVNAHCHTELSHLNGLVQPHTGLAGFVSQIRDQRLLGKNASEDIITKAISNLQAQGIVAVADICNTSHSFSAKRTGNLKFASLIEVLGLDDEMAMLIYEQAKQLANFSTTQLGQAAFITPHSVYALSAKLWELVAGDFTSNSLLSVHFAESLDEAKFTNLRQGEIYKNYKRWGLQPNSAPKGNPVEILKRYLPSDVALLLIHNTFISQQEVEAVLAYFSNVCFVLCPSSNLFIEQAMPNVPMLNSLGCSIALGTDSLASSATLSIFEQMQLILSHFPQITFAEALKWGTLNGAEMLGLGSQLGTIEIGKSPGLNLIAPFNFAEMKPYPNSRVSALC